MSESVALKINYQTLWSLLEEIRQSQQGYMWTYDFSVYPWRLNLVKMSNSVTASFRVTRNIESAKIQITDQDLINKLIFTVSNTDGTTTTIIKNNTTSQTRYGLRTRCTDIKVDELPNGMTADQYASAILAEHADPISSIQIAGYDLQAITGDAYDHITLGSMCEVVLPGYDTAIRERVVALTYADLCQDPDRLTMQLSTEIKPITGSLAGAKKLVSAVKSVRGGGGGGGGGKADTEDWAKVLTKTIDAVDGTGITELWQSGIVANAQTGVRIFSIYQGMQSMRSELNVNTEGISTLVTKTGINNLGESETLTSRISQQADRISLVVEGTGSSATIKRAAIIASINNGTSNVSISADVIDINGVVSALAGKTINVGTLQAASVDTRGLLVDSIQLNGSTFLDSEFTIDGVHKAYFLGTGDVNFDRAAARREGAASVQILAADIVDDGNPTWASDKKKVYIHVRATATNEATNVNSIEVDTTDAWTAGRNSVSQRTVSGIAAYGSPSVASGTCTQPTTVTFSDGNTQRNSYTTLNATAAYNKGWNDCRTWVLNNSHSCLTGYTTYNNGTAIRLYDNAGDVVASGPHVWRYGGTVSTYYSAPSAK